MDFDLDLVNPEKEESLDENDEGGVKKHIVEENQTNTTSVILHPLSQTILGHILKHTAEKSHTSM